MWNVWTVVIIQEIINQADIVHCSHRGGGSGGALSEIENAIFLAIAAIIVFV